MSGALLFLKPGFAWFHQRWCWRALMIVFVVFTLSSIILSLGMQRLVAQELAKNFGGFSADSNEPIDIEADELRVNDIKKTAVFRGNVKAVQGNFELRSKILEVFYAGSVQGGSGAAGKVKRLIARGKVLISSREKRKAKQTATSEWANFDVIAQEIILGDKVVLTQGGNVIKGGRLVIDLKTRTSRFINQKKKGRVQMKVDVSRKKKPN